MSSRTLTTALSVLTLLLSVFVSAAERREVGPAMVFGEPASRAQESGVADLLEAFKETWAAQDVEGHIALFSDDAEWINAYARMFRGTEELEIFLRERLFPAFDSRVSQQEIENANLVSIRYIGSEAAVIHLYTDGPRGESAIASRVLRRTHLHLVLALQDGQWKIAHTAIMDARD